MMTTLKDLTLRDNWRETLAGRVTIRILFYCDDADESWVVANKAKGNARRGFKDEFGLGLLKATLENQSTFFTRYQIDVINRYYDYDADGNIIHNPALLQNPHRLSASLLNKYSQIWVFGMHYGNHMEAAGNFGGTSFDKNAKDQEFTDEEIKLLRHWMDAGGGMLVTGDHSNWMHEQADYYNLGRALGKNIPRAGDMRIWMGNPVSQTNSSQGLYHVDTAGDDDMANMPKQEDNQPQTTKVKYIWHIRQEHIGGPFGNAFIPEYIPHPLFAAPLSADNPAGVIDVFPDHVHEGALRIPANFPEQDWPKHAGIQIKPEIISWGTNKAAGANLQEVGLVAAYQGKRCGIGNIVADSTWHHYINVNLVGFLNSDNTPDKTLRRLGQFYANLAHYLCHQKVLNKLLMSALAVVAHSAGMREIHSATVHEKGRYAAKFMAQEGLQSLAHSVIQTHHEQQLAIDANSTEPFPTINHTLALGHIIEHLQRADITLDEHHQMTDIESLLTKSHRLALSEALEQSKQQLAHLERATLHLLQQPPCHLSAD